MMDAVGALRRQASSSTAVVQFVLCRRIVHLRSSDGRNFVGKAEVVLNANPLGDTSEVSESREQERGRCSHVPGAPDSMMAPRKRLDAFPPKESIWYETEMAANAMVEQT